MTNKKGFTLIELLVVIAIIGLISILAVVSLNNSRARSRDAKRVADMRQVQTALALYFYDEGEYPDETADLVLGSTSAIKLCDEAAGGFVASGTSCTTTYMGLVPIDPEPNDVGYKYTDTDSLASFEITFSLEGKVHQFASGAHTLTPAGIE